MNCQHKNYRALTNTRYQVKGDIVVCNDCGEIFKSVCAVNTPLENQGYVWLSPGETVDFGNFEVSFPESEALEFTT